MKYLGDFAANSLVTVLFDTFDANGASTTISGLAISDIKVYKAAQASPGYITSLRASTSGYFLLDTDGTDIGQGSPQTPGIHGFVIDTSDNTDAGFFAAGNDYWVVVNAVLIGSPQQTVRFIAARWSIQNRFKDVNVVQISGDATAADNLELQFDGTGLTGENYPSTQGQVSAIGSATGGGLRFEAQRDNTGSPIIKGVPFVGVLGSPGGSYTFTDAEDGTYQIVNHSGNAIDIVYEFNIGGARTASECVFKGYLVGSNDQITIQAYDYVAAGWDTRFVLQGKAGTINDTVALSLLSKHTGTAGADKGLVLIRFVCTAQSAPILNVDELLVEAINIGQSVGYADGAIWIDGSAANTGTEDFVDGVADNPVSTMTAANTLSTSVGLNRFRIAPGTSITLSQSQESDEFRGHSWILALGDQSISQSYFYQSTSVTGTATTANGSPYIFEECQIGAVTLSAYGYLHKCALSDTLTLTSTAGGLSDVIDIFGCFSNVAGSGSPTITFASVTKTTSANIRGWNGGGNWVFTSDCTASIEVINGGTHTVTTGGGNIEFRGQPKAVSVISSGSGTVNIVLANGAPVTISGTGGIVNIFGIHGGITLGSPSAVTVNEYGGDITDLTDILDDTGTSGVLLAGTATSAQLVDDIWDEALTAATHNVATSAGRRLRQSTSTIIHEEIAQGPGLGSPEPTNQIQLDTGASAIDGAYDPAGIAIVAGTGSGQDRNIIEYDGTTKIATVDRDWKVNPDNTSEFIVYANAGREHVNEGLAAGGTSNTITLNALASSGDNVYRGQLVFIRSGTGADQSALITAYNGTTKVATVDPNWVVAPNATSGYVILPNSPSLLATATQASIDAIEVDTQDIQSRIPASLVSGKMDSDVTAINSNTTAAAQLARSAATIVNASATATTLSTTQMSTDLTEATNDHYNGRIIIWTSGVLQNQATDITAYNGTTKTLTFTATTEAPGSGDTFIIV